MPKVLLDNCVPHPLARTFGRGIAVTEARTAGLAELHNGDLLRAAHKRGYDALITTDTDYGKPPLSSQNLLPVVLLRSPVPPAAMSAVLAVLVPRVKRSLLGGVDPGLYVWDNYKGKVLFSRSLEKSEELRAEIEAQRRQQIGGR